MNSPLPVISGSVRLGLRENLPQFALLVAVNALVGGMLGQERTVVPLLGREVFHLDAYTAGLTFIVAFGIAKAVTNYVAGTASDRYGRKPVLVTGWVVALPVPLLLIWAPTWGWVVVANVLLGVSQGLTWSTTVIMKIDLVGPSRRGLAMGLNEAAGYAAVAATALATGWLAAAHGLRPVPFFLGVVFAALGLGLSVLVVRETRDHARSEAARHTLPSPASPATPAWPPSPAADARPAHAMSDADVFLTTSFRDRSLSAASQAGLVNNLNDGLAWGLFPLLYAASGLSVARIGVLAALYPALWGGGQLVTGALSDRWGRKGFISVGMLVQAAALGLVAASSTFAGWAVASVVLGLGTAMVYPTLLASIGDVAHPSWRARAIGTYRLWRDGGFAVGAVLSGVLADLYGVRAAIGAVAVITALSGVVVVVRMRETHTRG